MISDSLLIKVGAGRDLSNFGLIVTEIVRPKKWEKYPTILNSENHNKIMQYLQKYRKTIDGDLYENFPPIYYYARSILKGAWR